jgi:hypothetical protein
LSFIGQDLTARLGELGRIIESKKGRIELFRSHQDHLETVASTLLAYASARGISTKSHKLTRITIAPGSPDARERQEIERLVKEAQYILLVQKERLQGEFEQGLGRHHQIDSLVGEKRELHAAA